MREEELFYLALAQPPDRRATFLDGACADDPELRRRVEVLLRAHDEPGNFLARPPAGVEPTADLRQARPVDAGSGAADGGAAVAPRVDRVGPYKLLQPIGEGGMGTVYMAEQTAPVNRVVAVKLIRPGMDSRQVLARFEAERQALALMDHPNIARVLDAGETDDGRPFFAMELVKGVSITRFCDERKLTPKERLELFVPVCQALQHAHQKGVIHRDIKPSNVLVALYDGKPVPKVIDFGIAKAAGQKLTDKTLFTGFGAVVGTLEYMSPEQAELNQLDVDTRSDIYSLGVLLYELLTGTTPLDGKRLPEAALLDMLRRIREEEPPAPSARLSTTAELPAIAASRGTDPGRLARLVRGDLDWIVMRALEKDRSRRYDTAAGLAQDVGRYLRDEPVSACPPSAAYRARKFLRRNRGPVLAAGLLAAALVAGAAVSVYYAIQSADRARASAAAEIRADGEAEKANANADRARANEGRAIAQRDRARGLLYVARMQPMPRLWFEGKRNRVLEVLAEQRPEPDGSDLRAWEWHYQWRLGHGAVRTFDGHRVARPGITDPVEALAFSPDGRWLVSTGGSIIGKKAGDGEVVLWDMAAGKEARRLTAHTARVASAAFSPDGRTLATGAWDNTVRLWDAATGRLIHTFYHELEEGLLVAFSPDGRRLVSLSNTRVSGGGFAPAPPPDASHATVKVWDVDRGRELHGWKTGVTELVAFLPDGHLLTVAADGAVVRDPATGREVRRFPREAGGEHAAVSADGTRLAVIGPTGLAVVGPTGLTVYDLPRGRAVCQVTMLPAVAINALALSPDGRLLAVTGSDGAVRVWQLREGPLPAPVVFRAHDGAAASAAFSADGRLLATTGADGLVRVWDAEAPAPEMRRLTRTRGPGRAVFTPDGARLIGIADGDTAPAVWDAVGGGQLPGPRGGQGPVAYSPDGRWMATGCPEGIRIWDAATCRESLTIAGVGRGNALRDGTVAALAFAKDGRLVSAAPGPGDSRVQIWDPATGRELLTLTGHERPVRSIAFSPDGTRVAATGVHEDATGKFVGALYVWDAANGKLLFRVDVAGSGIGVAYSPDGRLLATTGSANGGLAVVLWDAATGAPRKTFPWPASPSISVPVFSPDGKRLAAAGGKHLKVWDVDGGQEVFADEDPTRHAQAVAFSPDGKSLVVSAPGDGGSGEPRPARKGFSVKRVRADWAAFSADGRRLATSEGAWGPVRVWDAATDAELHCLGGHTVLTCVAVSPDGRTVASGGRDGRVRLWDQQTWEQVRAFTTDGPVWALAFSPDGRQLAAGCEDGQKAGEVRVWDLSSNREAHRLRGHPSPVAAVAFGPDGTVLAVGNDGTIKVWDAAGRELRGGKIVMGERGGSVRAVAFSPDRGLVACVGDDSRVRLWDVGEAREVRALAGHADGGVYCVAFSPDGRRLASADGKEIKLWDVSSGQELCSVPLPVSGLTNQPELVARLLFSPDGGKLVGTGPSLRVWDARPLTPELDVEREALALLDWLFARPLPYEAVLAGVRAAPALAEPVRRRALELAVHFRAEDDPRRYAVAARYAAVRVHLPTEWHRRALVQAEEACALAPDDGPCLTALGMARYRLGRYEEALPALTRAEPLNTARPPGRPMGAPGEAHPSDLALLALTHHRLGHAEDARRYLARAREAMKNTRTPDDEEAAALLREAEAVIEAKNTP
jgi:WD40 repeat protein/serine/threonine protein kinase